MTERWLAVVDYAGFYEVSDLGNVRSVDRIVVFSDERRRFYAGRSCKPKISAYGYPLVLLSAGRERKQWCPVHLLVLKAFVGPPPPGHEACHGNGQRDDCRLSNLRYDTRRNNHADKWRHGTMSFGEGHASARLSDSAVARIVAETEGTITEIAAKHGVSRTHVWNIRNGKRRSSIASMVV